MARRADIAMIVGSKTKRNFTFFVTFHVARYVFPVLVTPFLAHYLLKDGYGRYVIINSSAWTSAIFMEFGFYLYGIARVAASDHDQLSREVSAIISSKLALLPVCVAAYITLTSISGVLFSNPIASIFRTADSGHLW